MDEVAYHGDWPKRRGNDYDEKDVFSAGSRRNGPGHCEFSGLVAEGVSSHADKNKQAAAWKFVNFLKEKRVKVKILGIIYDHD